MLYNVMASAMKLARQGHLVCVLIGMLPSVVLVAHEGEHVTPLQDVPGFAVLPIVILGLG